VAYVCVVTSPNEVEPFPTASQQNYTGMSPLFWYSSAAFLLSRKKHNLCQLAGVSRAGFYRHLVEIVPHEEEMQLRDTIQRPALCELRKHQHFG